jgi:hypothetical protein
VTNNAVRRGLDLIAATGPKSRDMGDKLLRDRDRSLDLRLPMGWKALQPLEESQDHHADDINRVVVTTVAIRSGRGVLFGHVPCIALRRNLSEGAWELTNPGRSKVGVNVS